MYDVTVNGGHGTLLCSCFPDLKLICEFFRLYAFHGLCNTALRTQVILHDIGGVLESRGHTRKKETGYHARVITAILTHLGSSGGATMTVGQSDYRFPSRQHTE